MGLTSLLDRRPIVVALAGPNGAGKSTFYEAHLARTGLYFINADFLSHSLHMDPYAAAELAGSLRRQLVGQRESFIFETVLSDPVGDKIQFLKETEQDGYTVVLVFIGLATPEISDTRVAMRAAGGGHDVPRNKLFERFPRTLANLKKALSELANVLVFDHSDLACGYRLIAARESGGKLVLHKPVPEWLRVLLP